MNAQISRFVAFFIFLYIALRMNWFEELNAYLHTGLAFSNTLSWLFSGIIFYGIWLGALFFWRKYHKLVSGMSLSEVIGLLTVQLCGLLVAGSVLWLLSLVQALPMDLTLLGLFLSPILFSKLFYEKCHAALLVLAKKYEMVNESPNFGHQVKKMDAVHAKILDTSSIIDGRIVGICRTGFLDGELIVPDFVVHELQQIADSADLTKRNRGRYGLDVLNQLQRETRSNVRILELSHENGDVDSRLVKLAKRWQTPIVTNDFNLMKVCELHGVEILNMNELTNALKTPVLPGEVLQVQIIKDGKEHGQGIGYLEDGTMIVVECGKEYIGRTIDVVVNSVLQTSAGKMIFSKFRESSFAERDRAEDEKRCAQLM